MNKEEMIPTIPADAIMKIDISGYFYMQLKSCMMSKFQNKSKEEVEALSKRLKEAEEKGFKDPDDYIVALVSSLIVEIETQAEKQDKLLYKTIDELKSMFKE